MDLLVECTQYYEHFFRTQFLYDYHYLMSSDFGAWFVGIKDMYLCGPIAMIELW